MKKGTAATANGSISAQLKAVSRYLSGELLGRPRTLSIEVTMRCNARCDFCSYWQLPRMQELKEYRSVVEKLRPLTVIITGGEPLMRKDLPRLVAEIKEAGPLVISLLTNGRLLTVEKARELRLAGLDTISVSLNHLGTAQDEERRIPGLYKHLSNLLPQLSEVGFKRVNVNTVFLDNNLNEILEIIEQVRRWDVGINFSSYSSFKADNHNYEIAEEQLEKLTELVDAIISLKRQGRSIENSEWYLKRVPDFYRTGHVPGKCPAGKKTVHVTPNGDVKPCPDFPSVAHYSEYSARNAAYLNCDKCWYACRGEVEAPITLSRAMYFIRLWLKGNKGNKTHFLDLTNEKTDSRNMIHEHNRK